MVDVVLLVFGMFLGAGGMTYVLQGARARAQARKVHIETLSVILQTALLEATRRRHHSVAPQHALWVLLEVPEVASAFEARAWPLKELRAALDASLTGLAAHGTAKSESRVSSELSDAMRRAVELARGAPVRDARRALLSALVRTMMDRDVTVADLFEAREGRAPYTTFTLDTHPPAPGREDIPEVPYRTARQAPVAHVVFLNDHRTTMAAVVEILTQVFALTETRATYLMLTVHSQGRVTVWSGARSQAEAMAARATTVARDKAMPLRICVEVTGTTGG